MKNEYGTFAKSILILFRLTAVASAASDAIQNKYHYSETILITSNEEIKNIMKIVTSPEESGLLMNFAN